MGDIFRKVAISSLTEGGETGKPVTVWAIVDTGASRTAIGTDLAQRLGGSLLDMRVRLEGHMANTKLIALHLKAARCGVQPVVAMVDNIAMARAGRTRDGQKVELILGHDYLEAEHVGLRYKERGERIICRSNVVRRTQSR